MKPLKTSAFLDACVIYPAPVRDLLLSVASEGLFNPIWSEDVHDEWKSNLLKNRPDIRMEQLLATSGAMNSAFPHADIKNYNHLINKLNLPDENDRHVLAAAITGKADYIITFNLKDFPNSRLALYNMEAMHPDSFLLALYQSHPETIHNAFTKLIKRLKNPPIEPTKVLQLLRNVNLTHIALKLENTFLSNT